jgi:hypothetical protein
LYSSEIIKKLTNSFSFTYEMQPKVRKFWKHSGKAERVLCDTVRTAWSRERTDVKDPLEREIMLRDKLSVYLEINDYGYGRYYEIDMHRAQ